MPDDQLRPPIPAVCAHRPTSGGLVLPYANVSLADGGIDFRSHHTTRYHLCWAQCRCQVHGGPTGRPAVLFGGPKQLRLRHFDEPPLCPACARYVSQACPMVGGRRDRYAQRPLVSHGGRGKVCATPGCDCGGWVETDPSRSGPGGGPAHPFYAVYIEPSAYALSVHKAPAADPRDFLVNGGILTAPPLKVVLVSEPATGRIWRTLSADEVTALMPPEEAVPVPATTTVQEGQ